MPGNSSDPTASYLWAAYLLLTAALLAYALHGAFTVRNWKAFGVFVLVMLGWLAVALWHE